MRILVTNEHLNERAGSDLFVRDLARGLARLGHFVFAYSSDLRERERVLQRDSIAVATDLESLTFRPDIIHARHHLDAMSAVLALPGVPTIYQCATTAWLVPPPKHPRIYRYLAPSFAIAERMSHEGGIAPGLIEVVPNAVDLDRFSFVRTPAAELRRALIYDDGLPLESVVVRDVRAAAAALGLELNCVGRRLGNVVDRPETLLPAYDIVFASGRSAVEALACGCAVMVVGETGVGSLADESNLERLREADFTLSADSPPPSTAAIVDEIARYSTSASAAVTQEIRRTASFEPFIDRLDGIYRSVVALNAGNPPDRDAEDRAAGHYLNTILPLIKRIVRLQDHEGDMSVTAAAAWLDASSRLAAVQRDADKPRW
jgi:hypothetical protein